MVSQLDSLKSLKEKLLLQINIIQLGCQLIIKPLGAKLLSFGYLKML